MESNEALASALVKFQRWCEDGGPMLYSKIDKLETQIAALAEENAKLKTAIANLPAAGDERWEKLRTFIEIYRPSCGDTEYAVALQNACDAIDNELYRLSPPPQEAGMDEIDNLPAAGDERWEKEICSLIDDYRASLNQGVLESDTGEDMLHHVTEDLERIRDRLSPPPQEAGDEPGK